MRYQILGLAAGALLLAGCSTKPTPTARTPLPALKAIPADAQQCGKEIYQHGEGYDPKMRDCLWQAVQAGKPATFTTTILTTEGDPITYTLTADAPSHGPGGRFAVLVDSKDKFGRQGQFPYTCNAMAKLFYQHAPNAQVPQPYGFTFTGCAGSDGEKVVDVP